MAPKKANKRQHGLQRPFSWSQIATWIIVPVICTCYYLTAVVFFEDLERILFLAIYSFLVACLLSSWAACTFLDSSLPAFLNCFTMKEEQRKTSMYCHICKKTSAGFDHHCAWLNTCIGSRNYPFFLILTFAGTFMNGLHLGMCVYLEVLVSNYSEFVEDQAEEVVGGETAFRILIALEGFLALVALFCFCVLTSFHIMLMFKGYGTYLFLLKKREKQRQDSYIRASKDVPESRFTCWDDFKERCCVKKEKELEMEISVVESTPPVRQSMASAVHESFASRGGSMSEIFKGPDEPKTLKAAPIGSTTYETSVNQEDDDKV